MVETAISPHGFWETASRLANGPRDEGKDLWAKLNPKIRKAMLDRGMAAYDGSRKALGAIDDYEARRALVEAVLRAALP